MNVLKRSLSKRDKLRKDHADLQNLKLVNRPMKIPPIQHLGYTVQANHITLPPTPPPTHPPPTHRRHSIDSIYTNDYKYSEPSIHSDVSTHSQTSKHSKHTTGTTALNLYESYMHSVTPPELIAEKSKEHICSICLSTSIKPFMYLNCGHFIHTECMINELLTDSQHSEITTEFMTQQKCPSCHELIPSEDLQCIITKNLKKYKQNIFESKEHINQTTRTIKELEKNLEIQTVYHEKLEANIKYIKHMLLCIKID